MDHEVTRLIPRPGYKLEITWENGTTDLIDVSDWVYAGGVFAPLRDPEVFEQVNVILGGDAICWPGDVDVAADTLWRRASEHYQAAE